MNGQEDPERQGSSEKREHEKTSGPMGAVGIDGGVGGGGGAVSSHRPGQDGNTPLPFISMIHLTFPAVSPPALG